MKSTKPKAATSGETDDRLTLQFKAPRETVRLIEAAKGRMIEKGRLEVNSRRQDILLYLVEFALKHLPE